MNNFTFVFRADQLELTVDALQFFKERMERERKTLGEIRDQSAHFKAGKHIERRIDELLQTLLMQGKAQQRGEKAAK